MRRLLVFALVVVILSIALVDAKKKIGKKEKSEKVRKGVDEKNVKKDKEAKFIEKPTKTIEQQEPVEGIPEKQKESNSQQCSQAANEEHLWKRDAEQPPYRRPHITKPKNIRVLTAYEQCKLECKKKRDQADIEEYVQRLKDELAQAETALAEQKAAEEQKLHEQQQQTTNAESQAQGKDPVLEIKVNKPTVVLP